MMIGDFNPRPRKEGDDLKYEYKKKISANFNPRPRKEGDVKKINTVANQAISIHALAKRATDLAEFMNVSRHFNPRPRKEGDSKFIQ